MAEAQLSRLPNAAGYVELDSSTYNALGLSPDSSLDDVIISLAYKSGDYVTIICEVLNPDGSPSSGTKVRMVDASGTNLAYTTNTAGKCMFKTNAGSANFTDEHGYFDLYCNTETVDCPVGSEINLILQRNTYGNGWNAPVITGTRYIKISSFLNTIDVTAIGGGGAGGATGYNSKIDSREKNGSWYITAGGGGAGNRGTITSVPGYSMNSGSYSVVIGGGSSTGNIYSDGDGIYSESRDHSSMSVWAQIDGYGPSGGTTTFGGNVSAPGGAGGNNSLGYNIGYDNSYTNRTTGYGYGDGGYCSWGCNVYYTTNYAKTADANGDWRYTRSIKAYVYRHGGAAGAVYLNNFQYKI